MSPLDDRFTQTVALLDNRTCYACIAAKVCSSALSYALFAAGRGEQDSGFGEAGESRWGWTALAITDHGCMFGVIEFFNECKKEGIKPILGMEAYMAPGDRRERTSASGTGGCGVSPASAVRKSGGISESDEAVEPGVSGGVLLQAAD